MCLVDNSVFLMGDTTFFDEHDVIFECTRLGTIIRVAAMDPATLTEVVLQGPAALGEAALCRTALQKLAFVLQRRGARR